MKQIYNGKLYNTETATMLGEWDNGHYPNNFYFCYEALYRKKTGEYFLYGRGGCMSKYSQHEGYSQRAGAEITPYDERAAKEWAERYLDADEYIAAFGEPEE